MRSANVSRQLTLDDAVRIWRRRRCGVAQHVLAADFGVNPGRVAEVLSGRRFPEAREISLHDGAGENLTPDDDDTKADTKHEL